MELDEDADTYSHTCRCSGSYTITGDQLSEVMKLKLSMCVLWPHENALACCKTAERRQAEEESASVRYEVQACL